MPSRLMQPERKTRKLFHSPEPPLSPIPPHALILGAGPGIGLAVARRFAREGFTLAVVARPGDDPATLEAELRAAGAPEVQCLSADLADAGALAALLPHLERATPEILIYNASGGAEALPSSLTRDALNASFQVNVHAPLACTQAVLPAMRRAQRGTILFTGGGLALEPQAAQTALSLGKTALRALALCLAEELEPQGIHVATLTIAGWVQPRTPFSPEAMAEVFWELHTEEREKWRREIILKP